MAVDINALFGAAASEGAISPASQKALEVVDLGAAIQGAMGVAADNHKAAEAVLVNILLDDSGSMSNNSATAVAGVNAILAALRDSTQEASVLVQLRYLNKGIIFPYTPLPQVVDLLQRDYIASGGTPLYDRSVEVLATTIAKTMEFSQNGIPVRSVTLIVTDGDDTSSRASTPADVASLVTDMLAQESHIVCGLGINDGHTDFKAVFASMGLKPEWVLTPGNSAHEIRAAFATASRSMTRASQSATSFSQASAGGFGAP